MGSDTGPEALLQHQDFVRGLARSLLADPGAADDVAQEAWLTAIQSPPAKPGNERGWLATVVRNAARMHWRGEGRRRAREGAAAKPEATISTAEVVEREQLRRDVVEAVLALDEPYRSAVLWRFYRDTPPREIAELRGIPVETVKSHIKRGLARLRDALASRHGGDMAKLGAVLAVVAGLSTDAVAGVAGATVGGAAMAGSKKTMAALAVVALIAIPAALHLGGAFEGGASQTDPAPLEAHDPASRPGGKGGSDATPADGAAGVDAAAVADGPERAAAPASEPGRPAALVVTVIGADGRPCAGASVHTVTQEDAALRKLSAEGPLPDPTENAFGEGVRSDASGRAAIAASAVAPGSAVLVYAWRGPDVGRTGFVPVGRAGAPPLPVTVQLVGIGQPAEGRGAVTGRAYLDGELLRDTGVLCNRMWQQDRQPDGSRTANGNFVGFETDGEGRWGFRNLAVGTYRGTFILEGASHLKATFRIDDRGVAQTDLRFISAAVLEGRLVLPPGTPLDAVRVTACSESGRYAGEAVQAAGGEVRYRVPKIPSGPGRLRIYARGAGSALAAYEVGTAGTTRGPEVRLGGEAALRGRLVDPLDVPIAGTTVAVVQEPDDFALMGEAVCDESGRFTMPSLPPGSYRLALYFPDADGQGFSMANLQTVTIDAGGLDLGTVVVTNGLDRLRDAALRVNVVRDGAAVVGAPVRIRVGNHRFDAVTAAGGVVLVRELPRGAARVEAGEASSGIGSTEVQTGGLTTTDVTVRLGAAAAMGGRLDPVRMDLGSLRVYRVGANGRFERGARGSDQVAVAADGRWRVAGLAPGRFRVMASTAGGVMRMHRTVALETGADATVAFPVEEMAGAVRIRIAGTAERASAVLRWTQDDGLEGRMQLRRWQDGGVSAEGLPEGPVEASVSWSSGGVSWRVAHTVAVSPGSVLELPVPWPADTPRGALSGRCDFAGVAPATPRYAVAWRDGVRVSVRFGEDGRSFRFPALAAGHWKIAAHTGGDDDALAARAVAVVVAEGATARVTLPDPSPK